MAVTIPEAPATSPVLIDTAATRAWRDQVQRRRDMVSSACDLIDVAAADIAEPLPALVAALLTRLLGHAVRPSQVDELVEARGEYVKTRDAFWADRIDTLTAGIAAGPVGGAA